MKKEKEPTMFVRFFCVLLLCFSYRLLYAEQSLNSCLLIDKVFCDSETFCIHTLYNSFCVTSTLENSLSFVLINFQFI